MRVATLTALLGVSPVIACGADDGGRERCTASSDCANGAVCLDGECQRGGRDAGRDSGDPRDAPATTLYVSLEILPVDPALSSVEGSTPSQVFQLFGTRPDGTREELTATARFSVEHGRFGTFTAATFTASGVAGGTVPVLATHDGATAVARTTVTVNVTRTVLGDGVPADAPARFGAPAITDAAREAGLVYPLDEVWMPNNVAPPTVQWTRGATGDLYRVRIEKPHLRLDGFVTHSGASFRYAWLVDPGGWRGVLESDPGTPATLVVDRLDSSDGAVIAGAPIDLHVAAGATYGAVYYWYWTGVEGRIVRIDADTATRTKPVPFPPPAPPPSVSPRNRCVGCHTISRDGRYLATGNHDGGLLVFDLTTDLSADPAPSTFPIGTVGRGYFYSFAPDASRVLWDTGAGFQYVDPLTGLVTMAPGLPGTEATHPEWSPDGTAIAFIRAEPRTGDLFRGRGDVMLLAMSGATPGASTMLHEGATLAGATEGGSLDTHPTWSPDSEHVAFAHGQVSYSGTSDVSFENIRPYPSALYLAPRSGGAATRLDEAGGGPSSTVAYWPTFSPFTTYEGGAFDRGHYWLAFMSRRDYGNPWAGTAGTSRAQLWITAIDLNPRPGTDPSHPPYWIPGQDVATANFGAVWAPSACRATADDCTASGQCCSGTCVQDATMPGRFTCGRAAECRETGGLCGAAADCCDDLTCVSNVCVRAPS